MGGTFLSGNTESNNTVTLVVISMNEDVLVLLMDRREISTAIHDGLPGTVPRNNSERSGEQVAARASETSAMLQRSACFV